MKTNLNAHHTRLQGFTLIEMLVVIAVFMILCAILFPAFGRARAVARQVKCTSGLHQLGLAFQAYALEYRAYPGSASVLVDKQGSDWVRMPAGGGVPIGCSPLGTAKGAQYGCAMGYYANPSDKPCKESVFWCPDDTKKSPYIISYTMNGGLKNPPFGNFSSAPYSFIANWQIKHPAGTYLLIEEGNDGVQNDGDYWTGCWERASNRHNGGSNVLFCDGHIKSALKSKIESDICNDKGQRYDAPNGDATTY